MTPLFRRKKVSPTEETSKMRIIWGNSQCSPLLLNYEHWEDFDTIYARHQRKLSRCPPKDEILRQLLNLVDIGWIEQEETITAKKEKNPRKKKEVLST
jgi:hypothetical protein